MSCPLFDTQLDGVGRLRVVATERADGDMHPLHADNCIGSWWMLEQVHGTNVCSVDSAWPTDGPLTVGDVLVTDRRDAALAVWSADCAPIILAADDGTVVAAHAGWRGLGSGVVDVAVDAAERGGGTVVAAVLGPLIHPCCYEFGEHDLRTFATDVGMDHERIAGATRWGAIALDVPTVVSAALGRRDVVLDVIGPCTACDDRWFSHRARSDEGRHATVVTVEAA